MNDEPNEITPDTNGDWEYNLNYTVTNAALMFSNCKNLSKLDLSNFDTRNVAGTGHMFYGCKALKSVYVTNCNAATVEKIKDAVKEAVLSEDIVKTSK